MKKTARMGRFLAGFYCVCLLRLLNASNDPGVVLHGLDQVPDLAEFGNVLAVLAVLGVEADVFQAIDPMESPRGKALVLAKAVGA